MWLSDHIVEIIYLSAPVSVLLFIIKEWLEDRKELMRLRNVLFDEMIQNMKIIQKNLDLIGKRKELPDRDYFFPLHKLSHSGWTLLLASGKLSKLRGRNSRENVIFNISKMYTQIILINQLVTVREIILYGPLRLQTRLVKGRKRSLAEIELDYVDEGIEKNLHILKEIIFKLNKGLYLQNNKIFLK